MLVQWEWRSAVQAGIQSLLLVWETLMTRSSQPNVHVPQGVQLPADPIADEATRPLDKMLRERTLRKEQQATSERTIEAIADSDRGSERHSALRWILTVLFMM